MAVHHDGANNIVYIDREEEINSLDGNFYQVGTVAIVVNKDGKIFMLNNQHEWKEM